MASLAVDLIDDAADAVLLGSELELGLEEDFLALDMGEFVASQRFAPFLFFLMPLPLPGLGPPTLEDIVLSNGAYRFTFSLPAFLSTF